jgi:hypothetical protein
MLRPLPLLRITLVVLVLAAFAYIGLKEGYDGYVGAANGWQRFGAVTQLIYGAGAVAALIALWRRLSWLPGALLLWGVALATTGGIAPVVWGGAEVTAGIISGVATALFAALTGWGALLHARSKG